MTSVAQPSPVKKASAQKRSPYIGVTKDGVKILRPKGRVDNITLAEARKAVAAARAHRLAAASKG